MWTKDLINFIPIYCHHWDCRLGPVQVRQAWEYLRGGGGGGWNVLVGGPLQLGLRFWFPPDPRRRCCSLFLNLNWWKGYCYHKILIMVPRVGDGDPSFPVHPDENVEKMIICNCKCIPGVPKSMEEEYTMNVCFHSFLIWLNVLRPPFCTHSWLCFHSYHINTWWGLYITIYFHMYTSWYSQQIGILFYR